MRRSATGKLAELRELQRKLVLKAEEVALALKAIGPVKGHLRDVELPVGTLLRALEEIEEGRRGRAVITDPVLDFARGYTVEVVAVKYVKRYAECVVVDLGNRVIEASPVVVGYVFGYPMYDVATDDPDITPVVIEYSTEDWTRYEIGTNAVRKRQYPTTFEAQVLWLNPTTDAYVVFNRKDGLPDKLEANRWEGPYELRVRELWVKGISAPGVLRLRAFG